MALVVAAKQDSVVHGASITLMIVSRYLVEIRLISRSFFFNLLYSKLCFSIVAYAYFYMISWILKEFWFLHNLWYIGVQTHWWRHHYNRQRLAFSTFNTSAFNFAEIFAVIDHRNVKKWHGHQWHTRLALFWRLRFITVRQHGLYLLIKSWFNQSFHKVKK